MGALNRETIRQQVDRVKDSSDVEQQSAMENIFERSKEEKGAAIDSFNARNQLLRETIASNFTPEQKERAMENLKLAHGKSLDKMYKKGEIDIIDREAQKWLPHKWESTTKTKAALGILGVVAYGGWKILKKFFGAAKEKTVNAAKATGRAAVKTKNVARGWLATAAFVTLGALGADHFLWGGKARKSIAKYMSTEKKPPPTTATV